MTIRISTVGTIATKPKLLNSQGRSAFCTFRVACNERRYDREQGKWIDGDTNWLTVNVFRSLAEHAFESFSTGDRIVLSGRLRTREWTNGQKTGTSVEVDADALGHDLRWGVSQFTKRQAPPPVTAQRSESSEGRGPGDESPRHPEPISGGQGGAASFIPAEEGPAQQGWLVPPAEKKAAA